MVLPNKFSNTYPNGIQLRENFHVVFKESSAAFYYKKSFTLNKLSKEDIQFIKMLQSGLPLEQLKRALNHPKFSKFLTVLEEQVALRPLPQEEGIDSTLSRQIQWLSHFYCDANKVQKMLRNKKVLLIGCGGTGSVIAMHLARAGVGNFFLIDPGLIDSPDLNRQLSYFPKDIGKRKTHVLSKVIKNTNRKAKVQCKSLLIESSLQLENILAIYQPDLIINCADKPVGLIQNWVARASIQDKIAALFGGVGLDDASIGPLLTSNNSKMAFAKAMEKAHETFEVGQVPLKSSICFTNSLASVAIAFEAFKYLTGVGEIKVLNQSYIFDFINNSFNTEMSWT